MIIIYNNNNVVKSRNKKKKNYASAIVWRACVSECVRACVVGPGLVCADIQFLRTVFNW